MAGAIKDNIPDGSKIALVNTMALLDRDCEQVRFTEFKATFRQTFAAPPPQAHFMAEIPVGTTILSNTVGNAGAALDPRTDHRVSPGTPDPGTGLPTTPRTGGTAPHLPTGVGPQITGQVPRQ